MQNSVKDLLVWQKSMDVVKDIYLIARKLPRSEEFGLTSQLCRAAVSIPSNIAEGAKRGSKKEFVHFLHIASGSAAEAETQLILVSHLFPSIKQASVLERLTEVQKMLTGLIQSKSKI
jgi:four helix bundle protein